jgi:hypothetical protein
MNTVRSQRPDNVPLGVPNRLMQIHRIVAALGITHALRACAVMLVFASVAQSQTEAMQDVDRIPDFTVQVWGSAAEDFNARVLNYFQLRRTLEIGLPAQKVTDDWAEIRRAERALAESIRLARRGALQGEIFTPEISLEFRRALLLVVDDGTRKVILEHDNPGEFRHRINGTYPTRRPLSTVPPKVLALLPALPDDLQYRFLGRHLILYDVRANVILDRMRCALQCTD